MTEYYFLPARIPAADEIKAIDWAVNPLGEPGSWPGALKTAVQMMLESRFPKAVVWGPDLITLFNDAFRPILGDKRNCKGQRFDTVWAEAWADIGPIAERAFAGEATFIEDFPLTVDRHGYLEQCYFTFCYSPIRDETGAVAGMMDTVIEMTGKVEAEQKAGMLNAELAHRMKNAFGMVQAIAGQTFRTAEERDDVKAFQQRLLALSKAQDVLIKGATDTGALKEIIDSVAMGLSVGDRIDAVGPAISLGPRAALSVSLIIHELSTNAIKYGALSKAGGQVNVRWSVANGENGRTLLLSWHEAGGPPAGQPQRKGFGSKLISMGLIGTGNVTTTFGVDGFAAEMTASLDQMERPD